MTYSTMKEVLKVQDVRIHVPDKLSFFNSPYISHKTGCAIDLYSSLSPIQGVVKKIIKLRQDYLTLIECSENKDIYAKLLHIKPTIKVNELVRVGDELGTLIWSNYFQSWTDPHIHLELRSPDNAIRAKGGYKLVEIENTKIEFPRTEIKVNLKPFENYIIATLPGEYYSKLNGFYGIKFGEGIICGGLPHYGYGALLKHNFKIFQCPPLEIRLNKIPLKGISLHLRLREVNTIKIIANNYIDFPPTGILSIKQKALAPE